MWAVCLVVALSACGPAIPEPLPAGWQLSEVRRLDLPYIAIGFPPGWSDLGDDDGGAVLNLGGPGDGVTLAWVTAYEDAPTDGEAWIEWTEETASLPRGTLAERVDLPAGRAAYNHGLILEGDTYAFPPRNGTVFVLTFFSDHDIRGQTRRIAETFRFTEATPRPTS